MKQETKELLDYIISVFDGRRITGSFTVGKQKADVERYNKKQQKVQAFLRSIPDIEKHLTEGGYIQDRNGTPICHGDKVKICLPCVFDDVSKEAYQEGILQWNKNTAQFEVMYENDEQSVVTAALTIIPATVLEKA